MAALAFIGDAVYEVYVRKHVMETGAAHSDVLHKMAVEYVSAEGQAKTIKALMEEELTEDELALVKRARNHRASNSKKTRASRRGGDIMTDKYATAFEALVGDLYLREDKDRLDYLVNRSFDIIEKG
ncbi:MAG: ribonuclease III [Clostridia bacterium]|nr:ribonuclease III [Clostridia bacterium]